MPRQDKKGEKLAQLTQLLALLNSLQGQESNQAMQALQMQAMQAELENNPLRQQLLQQQLASAQAEQDWLAQYRPEQVLGLQNANTAAQLANEQSATMNPKIAGAFDSEQDFLSQYRPQQLAGLEGSVLAQSLANEQAQALMPINIDIADLNRQGLQVGLNQQERLNPMLLQQQEIANRLGISQAQFAEKSMPLNLRGLELGNLNTEARTMSEGVNQQVNRTQNESMRQQMNQSRQAFPLQEQMLRMEMARGGVGVPPELMKMFGVDMGQLGGGGSPAQTLNPTTNSGELTPTGKAQMFARQFNEGRLNTQQLGQFAPDIMAGMKESPQEQWPEVFQMMQQYGMNPTPYSNNSVPAQTNPGGIPFMGGMLPPIKGLGLPGMTMPEQPATPQWDLWQRDPIFSNDILNKMMQDKRMKQVQSQLVFPNAKP